MSCQGRGTAGDVQEPLDLSGAGSGSSLGFMQVVPEEFTRKELHKLLDKARALAQYGIFDDTKRDLLVDLAETLDLLDALAAREEADLTELEETVAAHMDAGGAAIAPLPSCSHDCPFHSRIRH